MNNDEIVSDVITLIHSTTQSSYVICSQLSSKLFSYLSQIHLKDDQWNELKEAIERFDQSINHPDVHQFRQLIETISTCSNDCEERNYTLGRDRNTLNDSIRQLRDLLKSHVDLRCFLLTKLIEQRTIRLYLIDVMNLAGMNVGNQTHGNLFDIVRLLCQIDPTFPTSSVIDHPILLNCVQVIETNVNSINSKDDNIKSTVISALHLLTNILLQNEPLPMQTNSQLSNATFLTCMFQLIENNYNDDELVMTTIKFLLSYNLRFDYPNTNPVILTLIRINEQISCRQLIERLILLFNRNIDPIEQKTTNSVIKFFSDLFDDQKNASDIILFDSDRRLMIEIISRELTDRSCTDKITTAYLSLLELIFRKKTITHETCTRFDELQQSFQSYLSTEHCLNENHFIINEIIQQHNCFSLV
ncbi:unnamed protein product [Rotaria magnacalcarata]|uniref:SPIN90/Ldb17 leucine-rich domain-containing protein n=1 Tax=Rotaria magnacalcarata TaxID=392030 RepID=A0A818YKL8_9BILA|nr:unnamed protein product [Rotaria magnacalcarata]CAF2063960.1 unnamed protein product [Rotaria magnacalcarata]CAF2208437.1 unnamed protein product [Rotaria magnacalcarata]CAF3757938.1 unnamed protein product [Rotaria magnacalcarata]